MKITDWAVIFLLIVSPLLWVSHLHTEDLREVNRLQLQYTTALRTAAQDGGSALNMNELQRYETGYGSAKFMRADKNGAIMALQQSLSLNFGITDDKVSQRSLMVYIPAVVIIEYDGYSIYAVDESTASDGSVLAEHHFRPKKPYVYSDEIGNQVAFTLDSYVIAYDALSGEWVSGLQEELSSIVTIPLLQDSETFQQVRRSVIVRSIEDDLADYINRHNEYAAKLGVTYTFTLPVISQEEWNNTLNDVGVLIFLQGIPVGDRYYNNYALGGGRLIKRYPVIGGNDESTGIKYFYREDCSAPYKMEEVFVSERDAAAKGYFEAPCKRQGL
ncbi:hypothetical protein J2T12_001174 [Paenibacillus anaericanus]|uniref:hypothetical protein n=1 Tax=Paenibacillus anaericanus TaxID=170367 RepID=UPI0027873CE8|nr:hypothetical protein [Paenibacillus anaericanus]MDQ0087768.1 hypothetical protein [Paenibacillus anaericanus]